MLSLFIRGLKWYKHKHSLLLRLQCESVVHLILYFQFYMDQKLVMEHSERVNLLQILDFETSISGFPPAVQFVRNHKTNREMEAIY